MQQRDAATTDANGFDAIESQVLEKADDVTRGLAERELAGGTRRSTVTAQIRRD